MDNSDSEPFARRKPWLGRLKQLIVAAVVVGLIITYGSTYQVSEGSSAVVTRFGEPVRVVEQTGLRWKWSWPVETAHEGRHAASLLQYSFYCHIHKGSPERHSAFLCRVAH